jgi:hypothetical protein
LIGIVPQQSPSTRMNDSGLSVAIRRAALCESKVALQIAEARRKKGADCSAPRY